MKTNSQPPIFYSILGFAFILIWLILIKISIFPNAEYSNTAWGLSALYLVYKYFINWKALTILSFIGGLLLQQQKQINTQLVKYSFGLLLLATITLSFISSANTLHYPSIVNYISNHPLPHGLLVASFSSLVILLGYLSGQINGLTEYHFHYNELKKLFAYSVGLFTLWLLLNYFDVYMLIKTWHLGQVFLILDGLAINVVVMFMYFFLLIFLENFRIGKILLKVLAILGRFWPIQFLLIISSILFKKFLL